MMSRPGESRIEIAAAWAARLEAPCDESTNLCDRQQVQQPNTQAKHIHLKRINQEDLSYYDGESLEVDRLPAVILEVVDAEHGWVDQLGNLRHDPFEIGKEGRVIERPFRSLFIVPLPQRKAVRDGEPITVDLEVGGFAAARCTRQDKAEEKTGRGSLTMRGTAGS